jgi:hypothetical protein
MAKTSKFVAVNVDGIVQVHMNGAFSLGNYETLCGLDGDDDSPLVRQQPAKLKRGAKIDCPYCIDIWKQCKNYSAKDFAT